MTNKTWNKIGGYSAVSLFVVAFGGILILGDPSNGFNMVNAPRVPVFIWLGIECILALLMIFSIARLKTGKVNVMTFVYTFLFIIGGLVIYGVAQLMEN